MANEIITIEGLSKSYMVGHSSSEKYTALRDVLTRSFRTFTRNAIDMFRGKQIVQGDEVEEFWALKDVSFSINEGEVVGIVGRNGAGKSTLLKILSRITEPTSGRVRLRGRVASLLEVGTGFHPELTGRENIFLNGAILGMSRAEIKRQFDDIVQFAEVEKFLDTPVKRYSSGMYVRLAFAVAAHLDPEILVVDEVLAVGDAEFQKKCLGKMQSVARGGRTVLFVSHNLLAVENLCSKCALLQNGTLLAFGDTPGILRKYTENKTARDPSKQITLGVDVCLEGAVFPAEITCGNMLEFQVQLSALKATSVFDLCAIVYSANETRVCVVDLRSDKPLALESGQVVTISANTGPIQLVEGEYAISLFVSTNESQVEVRDLADLRVIANNLESGRPRYPANHRGVLELLTTEVTST